KEESDDRQSAHRSMAKRTYRKGLSPMRLRAVLAGALVALIAPACAQTANETLIGMWGYRTEFPVGLGGTLTVQHDGRHWHAQISGAMADAEMAAGEFELAFPNGGGAFRGHLPGTGLTGHRIRGAVV